MVTIPSEAVKDITGLPNTTIIEELNDAIQDEEVGTKHKINLISRFMHRINNEDIHKLLLECNTAEAAAWLRGHPKILTLTSFPEYPHSQFSHRNSP